MATYSVHKNISSNRVIIALKGYGPADDMDHAEVGTFDHDVNAEGDNETTATGLNKDGEHFLVAGAKQVLRDSGKFDNLNIDSLIYVDKASNAPVHAEDSAYATENLRDSGGEPHPDISTQLGGVGSEANDSQIEHGGADGNQDGSENRQEGEGESSNEDAEQNAEETEDEADGETVKQLKERIASITDKDELQKAYDDEKAGKNRTTALSAIEARAEELNTAE